MQVPTICCAPPNPRHIVRDTTLSQAENPMAHDKIEMGWMASHHGMLRYSTPHSHVSTLLIRVIVVNTDEVGDTSESAPLFALYSKVVEEDDNKIAKLQDRDAEGILLFVSPHSSHSYLHTPEHVILRESRSVYSLPLSPHCLQCRSKTSGQAQTTTPHSLHLDMPSG